MKILIPTCFIILIICESFLIKPKQSIQPEVENDYRYSSIIDIRISFKDSSLLKSTMEYALNNYNPLEVLSIQFRDMSVNDTLPNELAIFTKVKNIMFLNCKTIPKLEFFSNRQSVDFYNCNVSIENNTSLDSIKVIVIENCNIIGKININELKLLSDFRFYTSSVMCIAGNIGSTRLKRFEIANYTGPMLNLEKINLSGKSDLEYLVLHSNEDNLINLPKDLFQKSINNVFIYHRRLSEKQLLKLKSINNKGTVMFDSNSWSN